MKKPSEIKALTAKKAWFVPSSMIAITLFGVVYCHTQGRADTVNKSDKIDSQFESHETIHLRQAESTSDSWFLYYLKYIWQWLVNFPLIFVNVSAPYKFISFEMEAYRYQDEWDYCMHGALYQWKEFEKITLKEKRAWAKEYYNSRPKPYFTYFLREKLMRTNA
jgi:hypothetical protein